MHLCHASITMLSSRIDSRNMSMQGLICDDGCTNGQGYWKTAYTGTCSKSCGGGTQTINYNCVGKYKNGKEADCSIPDFNYVCGADPSGLQQCNMQPCATYSWALSDWSICSKICDGGLQTRNVTCSVSTGNAHLHRLSTCSCVHKNGP